MRRRSWGGLPPAILVGLVAAPLAVGAGACGDNGAISDAGPDAQPDGSDAAPPPQDAAPEADAGLDAGGDADADTAVYNDMTSASNWSTFNLGQVGGATLNGLLGSAYDGRFVYYVAANGYASARYDTLGAFTASGSWELFDTTAVTSSRTDYAGGLFDGRYVYLVPSSFTGSLANATRFDTQGTFGSTGSWSTFNTAALNAAAKGFSGATFDGRYVYLVPNYNGGTDGVTARYDTQATFGNAGAWQVFDAATVGATGFNGGVFDGRYVYLSPTESGVVARYDTQGSFTSASGWSTFNASTKDPGATSYYGAGFDGRYVYFAPYSTSVAVRYDTQGAFGDAGSWSTFDVATTITNAGLYYGTAFDGRYVYYVPSQFGHIARYDTRAAFGAAGSWSMFDLTTLAASATDFGGAAFDGRYLYLVPVLSGTNVLAVRFDAKSPPAMPSLPAFYGSFY